MWCIADKKNQPLTEQRFNTYEEANNHLNMMGRDFSQIFKPVYLTNNKRLYRMINEGLIKGDYRGILLPRISIDEYIPMNTNSTNIVIGFFIKGVPDAVVPFVNFCGFCEGVLDVDYGDSDTIPNTFVVYIEMDRERLNINHLYDLIEQTCMLAELEPEDLTLTFPDTNKKFPYDKKLLKKYFDSRDEKQNLEAQKRAEQEAHARIEQEAEQASDKQDEQVSESILVDLF